MPGFTREQLEESVQHFSEHISSVRRSDVNTCETSFNGFMYFCENDEIIGSITAPLKDIDVPFDEVWNKAYPNGSRKFDMPVDNLRKIAYLYQLCLKIFHNESGFNYMGVGLEYFKSHRLNDNIRNFNQHVIEPLCSHIVNELRNYQRELPEQSSSASSQFINISGNNPRVNVNSVDNSTNIIGNVDLTKFIQIEAALDQIPDPDKRRECRNSLKSSKILLEPNHMFQSTRDLFQQLQNI